MRYIIFCLLLLLPIVLMFQQNEFKFIFERMEVIDHNTNYVGVATAHNYKYNRTQAVVNLTLSINRDLGTELQIEVQAYKFASNEYRLFPLRFMFNFCEYVEKNDFGLKELFYCANLTGCPIKKGLYHLCNWKSNGQKFPPHIPQGSYMLDLKYIYRDIEVMFLQMYGSIKYPEVKGFSFF